MNTPGPQPFNPADLPLKEYHLPQEVFWWPPAPGWWCLLLLVILLSLAVYLGRRWWHRRGWRRAAHRELDNIQQDFSDHCDVHLLARELSIFLRRVCLSRFPDRPGTHLMGEQWLAYLDQLSQLRSRKRQQVSKVLFLSHSGKQMLEAAYNSRTETEGTELIKMCRSWLASLPPAPWRQR